MNDETQAMEDRWLGWAKRLQAISSTGLHFGESDYDKERYAEIATIANDMLSTIGDTPIERIIDLVPDFAAGYATPKIDVRGAIIRDGRILLVKEKLDNLWTLPGGYADVGISAAANVEKEVLEEASLRVRATRLYGVFHKARHEYDMDVRDFYKVYFLCEPLNDAAPAPGMETLDVDFFEPGRLPPLSTGRVIEKHIHLAFEFHAEPDKVAAFD